MLLPMNRIEEDEEQSTASHPRAIIDANTAVEPPHGRENTFPVYVAPGEGGALNTFKE